MQQHSASPQLLYNMEQWIHETLSIPEGVPLKDFISQHYKETEDTSTWQQQLCCFLGASSAAQFWTLPVDTLRSVIRYRQGIVGDKDRPLTASDYRTIGTLHEPVVLSEICMNVFPPDVDMLMMKPGRLLALSCPLISASLDGLVYDLDSGHAIHGLEIKTLASSCLATDHRFWTDENLRAVSTTVDESAKKKLTLQLVERFVENVCVGKLFKRGVYLHSNMRAAHFTTMRELIDAHIKHRGLLSKPIEELIRRGVCTASQIKIIIQKWATRNVRFLFFARPSKDNTAESECIVNTSVCPDMFPYGPNIFNSSQFMQLLHQQAVYHNSHLCTGGIRPCNEDDIQMNSHLAISIPYKDTNRPAVIIMWECNLPKLLLEKYLQGCVNLVEDFIQHTQWNEDEDDLDDETLLYASDKAMASEECA